MAENPRARKVADRIHEIVAIMIDRKLKDPRLGMVTVTDVRVTGDLQNATIFYTVLGDETERQASGAALESAKGMIRSEVGKQLGLRLTPTIAFVADALPVAARSIEDALIAARMRDSELARLRESAEPAGDADPYKKPAEDDE
ncbi:30S ribosome-binding factor RbfA [Flaviflexus equikiangi]|uniref:Ribosome-binding factor A n=1 Tax=Flaviflexus equikiangi TaxID=2758573 RepID=A0ABS2TGA6_9ACTO|nr:30S ribosome-binding factor RbfA [Flaviflexus equikiangi]MBM9433688.1 30S ribosome-binding factor RbfA [Flaviflexus equikiangi]